MSEARVFSWRSPWRWTLLSLLAFTLLLLAIAAQLWFGGQDGIADGRMAPQLVLDTFEHGRIDTSTLRGEVIVVNFWGSWCTACHEEAAALQRVWETYRNEGVVFIGVAYLDTERDSRAYLLEYGIDYPNGLDVEQRISKDFRIQGAPETFIINPRGEIQFFYAGPIEERTLSREIENALSVRA